jgi:MFS family permease
VGGFAAPYRDRPFALFVLLSFLVLLVFMQHFTALPIDMAAHGMSRAMLGLVLALNGILIVLVQPFLSPILARFNRSRAHRRRGGAGRAGLRPERARARRARIYALGVIVWTVGEMAVLPIANAVVADVALPEMRGRYQGAYGITFGLASLAAPLIGTAVLQRWGAPRIVGRLHGDGPAGGGRAPGAGAPRSPRLRAERTGALPHASTRETWRAPRGRRTIARR